MFAAASGASQRQFVNPNPPFDHSAFEAADDDPNLEGALKIYQSCRWGCLAHMSQTLHPLEGFDWNLRSYQPFIDAFPSDAEALNRRWESFTALMSKEELAALEDRSILNIADWDVLSQKSKGGIEEERARLRPVYAKILNKPKRNDVLRILRRIEGGERFADFAARIVPAFEEILADRSWQHLLLVLHGAVNRMIFNHVLNTPWQSRVTLEQDNCCLNIIDVDSADDGGAQRFLVRAVNLTAYDLNKSGLRTTNMEEAAQRIAARLGD